MTSIPKILVTGANGQLGKSIKKISPVYPQFEFVFLSREDMPIHHAAMIRNCFAAWRPQFCINCAAYTAVDRAEEEKEKAFQVNGDGVGYLAHACKEFEARLVHISTDYVFDGRSLKPYTEDDITNPLNVYGASKLKGEELCLEQDPQSIIIRSSWVYSEFGKNFIRTMLKLLREKEEINVVKDQLGSPTYAHDLAETILKIIAGPPWLPGIYHFCNEGIISWYDFAREIKKMIRANCRINAVSTNEYPTLARRPAFSALNSGKIMHTFHLQLHDWKESLAACLGELSEK
jgi:dTDP-4-dehydrorhamnose reductase